MKRRLFLFVMLALIGFFIVACGSKESKIDYYNLARYDDYASSAAEYGTSYNIYIEGKLVSTGVMEMDDVPYMVAIIRESKNKEWICKIGQAGQYSDKVLSDYVGKKVRCFGDYESKVDGSPVLELDLIGDHCIWLASGKENICSKENLLADEEYMIKWCDANCDDYIYSNATNEKITGTYKSTGLIENVKLTDSSIRFTLVQMEDEIYYNCSEYISNYDYFEISDCSKLSELEDGETVTIYYVINENGIDTLLGYSVPKKKLDYDLEDAKEATSDDLLAKKEYEWDDNCKVTFGLTQNRQDKSLTLTAFEYVNSTEDASISIACIMNIFNQMSSVVDGYNIAVSVNDSKAMITVISSKDKDSLTIFGVEEDGTGTLSCPSWFISDGFNEEYMEDTWMEIYEKFLDFSKEISY